jgi:hypothetical protein
MNILRASRWVARIAAMSSLCLAITIVLTTPLATASTGSSSAVQMVTIDLPTVLAAAATTGSSPCQGSNTVTWTGGGPASYYGHDQLSLGCIPTVGVAGYYIQCQAFMFYNGQQVTPSSSQESGTDTCNYTTTTIYPFLIFSRLTAQANFDITIISQPGYDVVWGSNSNICSGAGTPTATCQDGPYGVSVPFTSVNNYG